MSKKRDSNGYFIIFIGMIILLAGGWNLFYSVVHKGPDPSGLIGMHQQSNLDAFSDKVQEEYGPDSDSYFFKTCMAREEANMKARKCCDHELPSSLPKGWHGEICPKSWTCDYSGMSLMYACSQESEDLSSRKKK